MEKSAQRIPHDLLHMGRHLSNFGHTEMTATVLQQQQVESRQKIIIATAVDV